MNKEQFLRGAVSNLESKLSATKAELAEMKASLPQIKHDKELETKLAELKQVINKLPSRNSANLVNEIYNAIEQAKAFTQAKEQ